MTTSDLIPQLEINDFSTWTGDIFFHFLFKVKSTTSEAPTIQPTTIAQTTTDGDATETTNTIYPTTTMESETMFTTDTVPMMTDFTTIDGSSTIQGEILETEYPPMRSRIGSQEDGLLVEGRKIKCLSL